VSPVHSPCVLRVLSLSLLMMGLSCRRVETSLWNPEKSPAPQETACS
jgi:hypothetical protein